MPVTPLSIDNELLSTTSLYIAKDIKDARHVNLVFMDEQDRVHGKGKPQKTGGTRWIQGIGTGEHSATTRLQTGYEAINLSVSGVADPAYFQPGHVVRPVLISGEEEEVNAQPERVVEIAGLRVRQTMSGLMREAEKQCMSGSVVGWEDFLTVNGVDDNFGTANGFLEEATKATQGNAVGNLTKSDYDDTVVHGIFNQRYDIGAAFNSAGITGLNRLVIDCNLYNDGNDKGRAIFASQAGLQNYKRSVQAYERYVDSDTLDAGNLNLAVGGVKVRLSNYMPTAGTNSATDPVSFYLIDFNDIHFCWSKGKYDGYFGMDDWKDVSGEFDVRMTKIRVRGQLVFKKLSTSGMAFDGETF
jgi:hypothetical protein